MKLKVGLKEVNDTDNGEDRMEKAAKKEGRIDVGKIMKLSPIKDLDILMCGPLPMMKDLKKQFKKQGVSGNNIFFEDFALK